MKLGTDIQEQQLPLKNGLFSSTLFNDANIPKIPTERI